MSTTAGLAFERNPFPGLRPFREDEEYLFFGRESQVDAMVNKLAATHFLAVVGTSGSGKSSLVNCGLRPALHGGLMACAGTSWRMAQFRPGGEPLGAMARALAEDGVLFRDYQNGGLTLTEIIDTTIRMSKLGLIDIYKQAQVDEDVNLLVVVDQFEELFRYRQLLAGDDENDFGICEEATAFVNLLLEAKEQTTYPIYVVLTMRSDFLGDCAQFSGLAEAINAGQYLVPRMTRDERRAAISGPIGVGGAEVAPVLLTRLVNDVGDNPDQLSILQHALNRTWAHWQLESGDKGPLDLEHYRNIGTMAKALDQHAEKAYAELKTERKQKICEKLFQALTDKATDDRGVRRPTTLGTLCALADATETNIAEVIDIFRRPSRSFLMPPAAETLNAETVIDISHESLMRVWERLNVWSDEEARSARIYRRLSETAVLQKSGEADLLRDPGLQLALDWRDENQPNDAWAKRYHPEFKLSMAFLEESRNARDTEVARKEKERRRELERAKALADERAQRIAVQEQAAKRQKGMIFGVTFCLIIAIVLGLFAFSLYQDAEKARDFAVEQTEEAEKQRKDAEEQRKVAEEQTKVAEVQTKVALEQKKKVEQEQKTSHSIALASHALLELENDPALSFRLAEAALKVKPTNPTLLARKAIMRPLEYPWQIFLKGHEASVHCVAFSPDGQRIVTVSRDKTARIWDVETGEELHHLKGHNRSVNSAAFSPDGQRIVTASSDKTAWIWDVETGEELHDLKGHNRSVNSARFSPDGRRIVTASSDKTAWIWDVETGEELYNLKGHKGSVNSARFSPDGQRIVTASSDKTARIWDVETGEELYNLKEHKGSVNSARFSPDGRHIVTASSDKTARIWDVETGKEVLVLKGHKGSVNSARFSPDGRRILTASSDKTARIWDVETGEPLQVLRRHGGKVTRAEFSPDGQRIVTVSRDKTARIWDVETGKEDFVLQGHNGSVNSARFSPDGQRVVTASSDNIVRIWNILIGKESYILAGHKGSVNSARFSPDGRRIVTASSDKTAWIWDVETGEELHHLKGHNRSVNSARFSPDGRHIVTASSDKTARIWDVETGEELYNLKEHKASVNSARFSPDGRHIVTASSDKTARIWDVETGEELYNLKEHKASVNSARFSPDGQRILTASSDKTPRIWDVETDKEPLVLRGHKGYVNSARFSPDGRRIVSTAAIKSFKLTSGEGFSLEEDYSARVWNAETGEQLLVLKGHEDTVLSARFSPDGTRIVTASSDKTARIWDVKTGKELNVLRGHNGGVNRARFSQDGTRILTASNDPYDTTIRIWDVETGWELHALSGHVSSVLSASFSPDGDRIVTASSDKTARIWPASYRKVLKAVNKDGIRDVRILSMDEMIRFDFNDEEIIETYKQILNDIPTNLAALFELGCFYIEKNMTRDAESLFSDLGQESLNKPGLSIRIAELFIKRKKYLEAASAFELMLKISTEFSEFYYSLGLVYEADRKYDMAEKVLKKGYALDIENSELQVLLIRVYKRWGQHCENIRDYELAEQVYKKWLAFDNENPETHFRLAVINQKLGKEKDAIINYESAMHLGFNDARRLNEVGYEFAKAGENLDLAEKMLLRALELVTVEWKSAAIYDSLGLVYYKAEKYPKAVEYHEKSVNLKPNSTRLEHLGDAYHSLKEDEKAIECYEKAITKGGNRSNINKKIEELSKE